MAKIPEKVKEFLKQRRLAYVATSDKSGTPNIAPKGSLGYLDEENLIFADLFAGKTRKNLEANAKIAVAVVNPAAYEGYQFIGTVELLERGPIYDELSKKVQEIDVNLPRAKYAVKIKVEKIYDLSPGPNSGKIIAS